VYPWTAKLGRKQHQHINSCLAAHVCLFTFLKNDEEKSYMPSPALILICATIFWPRSYQVNNFWDARSKQGLGRNNNKNMSSKT
jgi:hypothetical protein